MRESLPELPAFTVRTGGAAQDHGLGSWDLRALTNLAATSTNPADAVDRDVPGAQENVEWHTPDAFKDPDLGLVEDSERFHAGQIDRYFAIKLKELYWSYFGDSFLAEDENGTFYAMTPALDYARPVGTQAPGAVRIETRLVVRMPRTLETRGKALRLYRRSEDPDLTDLDDEAVGSLYQPRSGDRAFDDGEYQYLS